MTKLDEQYQHRSHNKTHLMAHIIFATKYRKPLLVGDIRVDMMQFIFESCARHHWYIQKMETDRDHIHILIQYHPTNSITEIVARLKQESTYYIWKKHGSTLKRSYWKEHTFWSDGYFAASVGQVSQKTIEHYIESQG